MLVEINREISFIEISTILNTKISNDEEYYALKGRIIHDLCIDIEIKNLDLSLLNCNNITYDSKINPNIVARRTNMTAVSWIFLIVLFIIVFLRDI